jgi:hypothetical protein
MTEPRTIAGRAWLSGTRPYVRRALAATIVGIEEEATTPCVTALAAADTVLETLIGIDPGGSIAESTMRDLIDRAQAARRLMAPHLAPRD